MASLSSNRPHRTLTTTSIVINRATKKRPDFPVFALLKSKQDDFPVLDLAGIPRIELTTGVGRIL